MNRITLFEFSLIFTILVSPFLINGVTFAEMLSDTLTPSTSSATQSSSSVIPDFITTDPKSTMLTDTLTSSTSSATQSSSSVTSQSLSQSPIVSEVNPVTVISTGTDTTDSPIPTITITTITPNIFSSTGSVFTEEIPVIVISIINPMILSITGISTDVSDGELDQPVGGTLLPLDTTSLILAGAQTFSWMIPVVLSVLGIGLFVASRKSENS